MIPMALGLGEGGEQMYRQGRLSVQTRDWSERWFGLSTDSKAALVALLDQPGRKRGTVDVPVFPPEVRRESDKLTQTPINPMWIVALALRRPYTFTVFARLSDPKKRRQNWNLAFCSIASLRHETF